METISGFYSQCAYDTFSPDFSRELMFKCIHPFIFFFLNGAVGSSQLNIINLLIPKSIGFGFLPGQGPLQPAVGDPASAGGLD